jgi:hypothetical protein
VIELSNVVNKQTKPYFKVCRRCGRKFQVERKRGKARTAFCSSQCRIEFRRDYVREYQQNYSPSPEQQRRKRAMWRRRREKHRRKAIAVLGGKCVDCGSTKSLHFDHIKGQGPMISHLLVYRWEVIEEALQLCELRCATCHIKRHLTG